MVRYQHRLFSAIGAGAVQANMAVFGAEQNQETKRTWRYFDKYMIAVNVGNIIATSAIPYIQDPNQTHYFVGYLIATIMLFVAALLFIIGRSHYIYVKPHETVIVSCIPVFVNAFQTWRRYKKSESFIDRERRTDSFSESVNDIYGPIEQERIVRIEERPARFLDFAKQVNHGKFHDRMVDDVHSLRDVLLVFSLLIPYWLIYDQVLNRFYLNFARKFP